MSKPPFVMSKYVNELDLQRDARKYYQEKSEKYEKALIEMGNDCGDLTREGFREIAITALSEYHD